MSAFSPLLDVKLSEAEIEIITEVINKHNSVYRDYHNLRTRKSGMTKYIDLHLVFPENMTVKDAHDLCDIIEADIERLLKNTEVLIHIESCKKICNECNLIDNNNNCK